MPRYLTKRAGFWQFVRNRPEHMIALEPRAVIRQSTKIRVADDPRGVRAAARAEQFNAELEAYWQGLLDGQSAEASKRYEQARRRARMLGFDYATVQDIASQPELKNIVARVLKLVQSGSMDDDGAVTAVLGLEPVPPVKLSEVFDRYEKLERTSIADYSEDQLRKWRNPRRRAMSNLLKVVPDKPISALVRADALDFRTWWQDRIQSEGLQIESANKDIGHLHTMLTTIDRALQANLPPVFADLRIRGGVDNQRQAFPAAFVQEKLLADDALEGLNDEARGILFLMVETGLRITEACNLTRDNIVLHHKVPHVRIRAENRRLKTPQSEREIPLVGVALKVMNRHPEGFPRYYDAGDSVSAVVNKFLRSNGLRPSDEHSLYSLRHTFEDRLYAAECPEKYVAALMGHKYGRPKYGGPSLEELKKWLDRIAFKAPARV